METVNRPDWYLNIKVWKRYEPFWGPTHPQLVTAAVPVVRAMTVALKHILADGYDAHIDACVEITEFFREEVRKLGYDLFIPERYAHGVTAISVTNGKAIELSAYFKERHQILIGGGLGPSKGKVVRNRPYGKDRDAGTAEQDTGYPHRGKRGAGHMSKGFQGVFDKQHVLITGVQQRSGQDFRDCFR